MSMAMKRRQLVLHCQLCHKVLCGIDCLKSHALYHHTPELGPRDVSWAIDKSIFNKEGNVLYVVSPAHYLIQF